MHKKLVLTHKIVFIIVCVLAALNLASLFSATNIHHGHIAQAAVSVLAVLYAAFFRKIPRAIHVICAAGCAIVIGFAVFLAIYGNRGNPDFAEDVVIVLGAGLSGEEVGTHLARRLDTAIGYLNQNPDSLVIVCGGLGATQLITEAEAMRRYLVERGISPARIIMEDLSTSTYENLLFANEILSELFPQGFRAVLVTNDFHIFRAMTMAREIGIDAVPLGAPTPRRTIPANYLREMLAVLHMWVFGT